MVGLFTRCDLKDGLKQRNAGRGGANLTDESLERIGERGVIRFNPRAKHPNMRASGKKRPLLYVLGEAPSPTDDQKGKHFSDVVGREFRDALPDVPTRFHFCCPTLPPKGRRPERNELGCFRPSVVADIAKSKPKVILAVGNIAAMWCLRSTEMKKANGIQVMRGRRFLANIGGHSCWVVPVYTPNYIDLIEGDDKGKPPGREIARSHYRDLASLHDIAKWEAPKVYTKEWCAEGVASTTEPHKIVRFLKALRNSKSSIIGGDLETSKLRPYSKGAQCYTMAFGDDQNVLAFPFEHPEVKHSRKWMKRIRAALIALLTCGKRVVFHNVHFDMEWLVYLLGRKVAHDTKWVCTLQQAYILDERVGGHSLEFVSTQRLGLNVKAITKVDRTQLLKSKLSDVLFYNGIDVRPLLEIERLQQAELRKEKLWDTYKDHMRRMPALVLAQFDGVPVSQQVVKRLAKDKKKQIKGILRKLHKCKEIKRFSKRFGEFKASSPDHCVQLFRDMLKCKEGQRTTRKGAETYSTDEEVLKAIDNEPARLILQHRQQAKLLSTYIMPMSRDSEATVIYPDDMMHTSFNAARTNTGRLASRGPNLQNFPMRNLLSRQIREAVTVGLDEVLLAVDYGQIEYRGIGWASGDHNIVQSTFDGYDVHMHWAERIAKVHPQAVTSRYGNLKPDSMKQFRSEIKNRMVFPAFYGAKVGYLARLVDVPEKKFKGLFEEFWDFFKGVLKWQKRTLDAYAEDNYVAALTGRRRHGPMKENEIINSPIQATASEVVMDAFSRLSVRAHREETKWLQPRINIHDDITFIIPRKKIDEAIATIAREMCDTSYDFVNTPLLIEMKQGKNWLNMEECGKFDSRTFKIGAMKPYWKDAA